jgi:hypothetical protein
MATFTIPLLKTTKRDGAPHVLVPLALLDMPTFQGLLGDDQAYFLLTMLRCASEGGRSPYIPGAHASLRGAGLILVTDGDGPSSAAPAARAPRPPASDELRGTPLNEYAVVMFRFPCDGLPSAVKVYSDFLDEMAGLFPSADVAFQFNKALAWTLARPERRKTARGLRRFLTGWLDRNQNRGWGGQAAA